MQADEARDGAITREDMISLLQTVASWGPLTAANLSDLEIVLDQGMRLNIANYVQVLGKDVVFGSPANAHYQGNALGDLAVGSNTAAI